MGGPPERAGLLEEGPEPVVRLLRWTGPPDPQHPDANLQREVAVYSLLDPVATLKGLARRTGIPLGALARYVLARWAAGGSEALLALGTSGVAQLAQVIERAEAEGSDAARLEAYTTLRELVRWLQAGAE